jgi:hypothetical protein
MTARRDERYARRQCARFGCSAPAAATFSFDSGTCTVWLDLPSLGVPRAGDLCDRHAESLTPPRGWQLDDRRVASGPPEAAPPAIDAELHQLLDARTPLLARAFRSSGAV